MQPPNPGCDETEAGTRRGARRTLSAGFTLLELLVVMGIMLLLMSTGVAGYFGMRRGAEMRGASSTVQTTLMLARQQAITKRRTVDVNFLQRGETNSIQVIETETGVTNSLVHGEVFLSPGIEYDKMQSPCPPAKVTFVPTGKAGGTGTSVINLVEKTPGKGNQYQTSKITVWLLTGTTKVETSTR